MIVKMVFKVVEGYFWEDSRKMMSESKEIVCVFVFGLM